MAKKEKDEVSIARVFNNIDEYDVYRKLVGRTLQDIITGESRDAIYSSEILRQFNNILKLSEKRNETDIYDFIHSDPNGTILINGENYAIDPVAFNILHKATRQAIMAVTKDTLRTLKYDREDVPVGINMVKELETKIYMIAHKQRRIESYTSYLTDKYGTEDSRLKIDYPSVDEYVESLLRESLIVVYIDYSRNYNTLSNYKPASI